MSHGNEMICQPVTLSGYAEWPKVADAVIEAVVSLPAFVSTGCEAAGFTTAADAAASPMANADLRLTFLIGSLLAVRLNMTTVPR